MQHLLTVLYAKQKRKSASHAIPLMFGVKANWFVHAMGQPLCRWLVMCETSKNPICVWTQTKWKKHSQFRFSVCRRWRAENIHNFAPTKATPYRCTHVANNVSGVSLPWLQIYFYIRCCPPTSTMAVLDLFVHTNRKCRSRNKQKNHQSYRTDFYTALTTNVHINLRTFYFSC